MDFDRGAAWILIEVRYGFGQRCGTYFDIGADPVEVQGTDFDRGANPE